MFDIRDTYSCVAVFYGIFSPRSRDRSFLKKNVEAILIIFDDKKYRLFFL